MTVALLAGLCAGIGVWLAWTGARPGPDPSRRARARPPPSVVARPWPVELDDRDARVGGFLIDHVPLLAQRIEAMRADLRMVGRTPEEQAVWVGAAVLLPLAFGPWVGIVCWVFGFSVPPVILGGLSLGAAAGARAPVRQPAICRLRAADRVLHALSSWCDVVVMTLASGRGVEQAMETAGRSGQGWAFAELRGALHGGYVRGEPPWVALERLGVDLGLPTCPSWRARWPWPVEEGRLCARRWRRRRGPSGSA